MSEAFTIYDALLWEPPEGYFLLEYHLRRLERSAMHFRFPVEVSRVRQQLLDYAEGLPDQAKKVRLELACNGATRLSHEPVKSSAPVAAVLSGEPVHSTNQFLYHKTSARKVYSRALSAHPEAQDVILWNERGELTETCYGNLVLEIEGRRLTPPLSCGLLPGVFRACLLDRGQIQEQILPVAAMEAASSVFMINSVRKWCVIRLLRRPAQT